MKIDIPSRVPDDQLSAVLKQLMKGETVISAVSRVCLAAVLISFIAIWW